MDPDTRNRLRFVGVQLALVAAGLHLVWGVPRLFVYLRLGRMPDPRPPLFILAAFAVVAAAAVLYVGAAKGMPGGDRGIYAFLAAVMGLYLLGYVAWHLGGHPILGEAGITTTYHPATAVSIIGSHLRNDAFALVAALVEIGAITALVPLAVE